MKLTWKQIDPFLKSPDPKARVVLVYGPDDGLMRERVTTIAKTVTPDLDDPFNVVTLTADIVHDDPARLNDEANAMSMMGGARLIKIEDGADKLTTTIKSYLENPSSENLVIIEADGLGTRSSLRKLCEGAKNAAALPCYVEDERGMGNLIRETLSNAGFRIEADALHLLSSSIIGDRMRARGEIEKLITYMGEPEGKNLCVGLDDVRASCGDAGAASLDDLIYAVAGGTPKTAMNAYQKLIGEGVADIIILRSLQNHFRRLHYVGAKMDNGEPLDVAMKGLQPPVFFKVAPAFKSHVSKWRGRKLNMVMDKLSELEAQTKQTGAPVQTLCSQAILSLSVMR